MTTALALRALQSEHVTPHETGLHIDWRISWDEWESLFPKLEFMLSWSQFALGDWYNAGWDLFGERCYQAFPEHYSERTIENYGRVAKAIDAPRRREGVTYSHHAEVYRLPPDQQDYYLSYARSPTNPDGMSVRQLRDFIQGNGHAIDARQPCPHCGGTGWVGG